MKSTFRNLVMGLVLGVTLVGVSAVAYDQAAIRPQAVEPRIIAGEDLGFRMTARKGETPVGQLVIRSDGEWKEVEFSYGMKLLTK
ncbi:MAG: hypothetical protein AB7Q16_23810 [Vicinamibacterales bacterium]